MDVFNFLSEQLTRHLWAVSWQVSILIGLIWIIDRLSFRASSLFRYMLWCIVLLRLCIPVSMTIPVSIEKFFVHKTGIDIPVINTMIPLDPITQRFEFKTLSLSTSMENPPEPAELNASKALYDYAGILWFTAVFLICALILVRVLWIKHLLKRCAPVKRPDLCSMATSLRCEMGIRRPVGLFYINMKNVDVPSVIGIFRPCIFLPRKIADEWALEDIEPVLLHELAHVKRRDLTINWLQVIVQVVYFFHPLVWLANRRMRRLREELCDDIAVNKLGAGRKHYTRSILRVMEESFREPVLGFVGLGFSERKNTIGERIRRIMSDNYKLYKPLNLQSIAALFMISIVVFAFACENSEDNIQGVWMTTHLDDKEVKSEQTWSFANNRLTIEHPDSSNIKYSGNFTINEKSYPKRIEFDLTEFKNGDPGNNITSIGIYKIKEDILVIKVNENGGGFPKDFKIEPTTDKINFKKLKQGISG